MSNNCYIEFVRRAHTATYVHMIMIRQNRPFCRIRMDGDRRLGAFYSDRRRLIVVLLYNSVHTENVLRRKILFFRFVV